MMSKPHLTSMVKIKPDMDQELDKNENVVLVSYLSKLKTVRCLTFRVNLKWGQE